MSVVYVESVKVSRSVLIVSCALLIFGIAAFSSSMTVVSESSGLLGGVWYVGVAAVVAGCNGFLRYSTQTFKCLAVSAWVTVVLALVGIAISASEYNFFNKLEVSTN